MNRPLYVQPRRLSPWADGLASGFLLGCFVGSVIALTLLRLLLGHWPS